MYKGIGFPYFMWQEEIKRNGIKEWRTLDAVDVWALNEASAKNKKKIILPSSTSCNRKVVSLINMSYQQSSRQLRCYIFNHKKEYVCWLFENNRGSFVSFAPRFAYFLEVVFSKTPHIVEFHYKVDYEVDFENFMLKNKKTNVVSQIMREPIYDIEWKFLAWPKRDILIHHKYTFDSNRMMKIVSTYSINSMKNLLYSEPISDVDFPTAFVWPPPCLRIINLLKQDAQISNSDTIIPNPFINVPTNEQLHVFSENGMQFSAVLIHVDIEENINKFFKMQLLQAENKERYYITTHNGRVGCDGRYDIEYFSDLNEARKKFEDKFFAKTKNKWAAQCNFERKKKQYDFISMNFLPVEQDLILESSIKSKLDEKIQDLLILIFEAESLEHATKIFLSKSLVINFGVPTTKQLLKAFEALEVIGELLSHENKDKELLYACNNYYMKMPHKSKMGPKAKLSLIMTAEAFEEEMFLLQTLSIICLSRHKSATYELENPMDLLYESCKCKLTPLDNRSEKFQFLSDTLSLRRGPTHNYDLDLIDAFSWEKESEELKFIDKGNKMLLWHGTHVSNILGIMKYGLKLPSAETPLSRLMFGRALYFADVFSKSANYCYFSKNSDEGLLLLCEVSIGNPERVYFDGDYSTIPDCYNSVIGVGQYHPIEFVESQLSPGAVFSSSPLELRENSDELELKYNEYAIYDERQVKVRYLLRVVFKTIDIFG